MKFKHIIPTLFALSMLTACNSRPKYLSDKMYNYAESVIRTADAYSVNSKPLKKTQDNDNLARAGKKIMHNKGALFFCSIFFISY